MKNKILGLPKAAVIVIGIVITALFLVLMNLVGGVGTSDIHYRQLHVTADRRDRCSNLCNRYAVSYGISAVA